MEIKKEIIEDVKELSQEQKEKFAKKIADNFAKWDEDRNSQITTAKEIMAETYLNQSPREVKKGFEWKSDVKLNGLYNIKRAKKAVLWREIWSNPSQMFDVRGTNEATEKQAKQQKAAIVDSLEKMEIGKQYDKSIDDLFDIGEMIFKTDWEKRTKVVKRQKRGIGFVLENVMRMMTGAGYTTELQEIEKPYYENARVESISPFMFVFDHAKYKLKNKASWDSITKIYKRFDSLENIKSNSVYKLTPEMLDDLKKINEKDSVETEQLVDLRDKDEFAGEYSILYAHGDFKIGGKWYKNYIAEVLAGKYLIRFEENPMYINPFILCALEFDPKTKRGISPLKSTMAMCKKEEDLTNTAFDAQKLMANPPCWCNEDLVNEDNTQSDGTIPLAPGKYIKIDNSYTGSLPVEVKFSTNGIADLLGLLGQKISDLSSVSSVMYGNIEASKRTATELSLADKGSSSQASKELDIINQDFTIPMIQNVAELWAMFGRGVDYVYAEEKGKNIEYRITEQIRQAEYNYIYEDRNAINDRKAKFQEIFQLFQAVGQNQQLFALIDWKEVIVTAVEMVGFDNTDKFFVEDTPAQQFSEQLKQIPPQMQQQVVGMFSQQLQQMAQQYQMQQQQAQMQAQAQKQVQMQQMRDQARQQAEMQAMGVV
jgi:hypothetical protein